MAIQLFNRCWELLESTRNSDDDVEELLTAAFGSRYHWLNAGGPEQWIVSDWMVARAAAALGHGELAILFAERAHSAAQDNESPDWLVASTAEGVARAYAANRDVEQFNHWFALATRLIDVIADSEDHRLDRESIVRTRDPLGQLASRRLLSHGSATTWKARAVAARTPTFRRRGVYDGVDRRTDSCRAITLATSLERATIRRSSSR